jgi:HPt (histidine-containing phosphotransfer) domain-containing protein
MDPMPLNPATLESLKALADPGDRGFLRALIGAYLSDTEARLAVIRKELGDGQPAALARTAHSVMGSSLSVGADALAALMRESVRECRNGTLPAPDRLRAAEAEFSRVKKAMLAFLG